MVDDSRNSSNDDEDIGERQDCEDVNESKESDNNSEEFNNDTNKSSFVSSWKLSLPDEFANIRFISNNTYSGRISRKMMEGEGVYKWSNGARYKVRIFKFPIITIQVYKFQRYKSLMEFIHVIHTVIILCGNMLFMH